MTTLPRGLRILFLPNTPEYSGILTIFYLYYEKCTMIFRSLNGWERLLEVEFWCERATELSGKAGSDRHSGRRCASKITMQPRIGCSENFRCFKWGVLNTVDNCYRQTVKNETRIAWKQSD